MMMWSSHRLDKKQQTLVDSHGINIILSKYWEVYVGVRACVWLSDATRDKIITMDKIIHAVYIMFTVVFLTR